MRVSLFVEHPVPRPWSATSEQQVLSESLEQLALADQVGFHGVWVTEHHFSGYGSIGVPSVYAAGIAQRTRRIRIGYGVAVVPLHHPLRLAEEISWVDHMSRGAGTPALASRDGNARPRARGGDRYFADTLRRLGDRNDRR